MDPESPFRADRAQAARTVARKGRSPGRGRRLVSWLAAAAIVAAAVYAGARLVRYRLAQAAKVDIGTATLAAPPVGVPAPGDGQMLRVFVHPTEAVPAGTPLARVRVFGGGAYGRALGSVTTIRAPVAGVVGSVAAPAGDAVHRGDPVIGMYGRGGETFEATVGLDTLGRLRKGMRATLTSSALSRPIAAVVDHVVSSPSPAPDPAGTGAQPSPPSEVTLVLRPGDPRSVRTLMPGLPFDAVVDTDSGPAHGPSLVRVNG